MALSTLLTLLQVAAPAPTNGGIIAIRIVAGVLALVMVGLIIFRSRAGAKKAREKNHF
jgi:hypothetical protein